MPQYAGSDPPSTAEMSTMAVISWLTRQYDLGLEECLQECFEELATIKSGVVPGDTSEITASAVATVRNITTDNVFAQADLIADLIT